MLFYFIIIEALAHFAEEIFLFPEWATKYFGTTTIEWYILSHLFLTPVLLVIIINASRKESTRNWVFLAVSAQTILLTNALFHLSATAVFGEYSPGIVSSVLITIPFSIYFYFTLIQKSILSTSSLLKSMLLGTLLSLLIIASLYLNVNLNI